MTPAPISTTTWQALKTGDVIVRTYRGVGGSTWARSETVRTVAHHRDGTVTAITDVTGWRAMPGTGRVQTLPYPVSPWPYSGHPLP